MKIIIHLFSVVVLFLQEEDKVLCTVWKQHFGGGVAKYGKQIIRSVRSDLQNAKTLEGLQLPPDIGQTIYDNRKTTAITVCYLA